MRDLGWRPAVKRSAARFDSPSPPADSPGASGARVKTVFQEGYPAAVLVRCNRDGEEGRGVADSLGFESFCFAQNASLIRLLTLYCGDVETARDLTQETLARAWVHWRGVARMDRPDLWVKRVALNLANSHFRRRRIERLVRERASHADHLLSEDHDSVQRLDMRDALRRLSDRQRAAVVLRFLEDLSVDQTAELMNCSPGTVKKLTARALTALRDRLGSDVEVVLDA